MKMPWVVAVVAPALALGVAARHWAPAAGDDARFDWFTYEGHDSVYATTIDASHLRPRR